MIRQSYHLLRRQQRQSCLLCLNCASARHRPPLQLHCSATHYNMLLSSQQQRPFSDRLLGYSPMAPAAPLPSRKPGSGESRFPTQEDVSLAGGVWNPTSAKRDKLGELKVELTAEEHKTLDDAATDEQKLDLYLTDGIQWIVHTVDQTRLAPILTSFENSSVQREENDSATTAGSTTTTKGLPRDMDPSQWDIDQALTNVDSWLGEQVHSIQSTIPEGHLQQQQWETYLSETIQKLDEVLATLPSSRYLRHVRDFYEVPAEISAQVLQQDNNLQEQILASEEQTKLAAAGSKILARYRLQLTRATCEHLKESWDSFTTLSDEAMDRLAVKTEDHESSETSSDPGMDGKATSLPLDKVTKVLRASLMGDAIDRVDAWWDLVDQDGDGLLEKTEMELVASCAVTSVQSAILSLFEEALEASPVRGREHHQLMGTYDNVKNSAPPKQGWRERRREAKAKKRLLKSFQRAVRQHFQVEVEMPHRLRCIYAWAEKAHQDNKIDSVLIEASGWSGRKRYVELHPKISLPEFREVQQVHFTHLDRIGWEITKSFREDLWVEQGKGRQNAELKRDCTVFLLVVSLIDYGIIIL